MLQLEYEQSVSLCTLGLVPQQLHHCTTPHDKYGTAGDHHTAEATTDRMLPSHAYTLTT